MFCSKVVFGSLGCFRAKSRRVSNWGRRLGLRSGNPRWGKDKQSWTISKAHSARCKSYEFEPETKRIQRANQNDKDNVFLHDENLLPASGDLLGFGSTLQMQWADLFEMANSSGSTSTATASTTPHGRFSPPD